MLTCVKKAEKLSKAFIIYKTATLYNIYIQHQYIYFHNPRVQWIKFTFNINVICNGHNIHLTSYSVFFYIYNNIRHSVVPGTVDM